MTLSIEECEAQHLVPDLLAALNADVDAYYEDRITYEEFNRRMRAIWERIHALGWHVEGEVLRRIRTRMQ